MNILRAITRLVKLLGVAFLVAVLGRAMFLIPPDVLPAFWIAVILGLATIALPAFDAGWNEHARNVRDADIRKARQRYDQERR